MGELSAIQKTANVKMGRGSYEAVEHDEVARVLHPLMHQCGLNFYPTVKSSTVDLQRYMTRDGEAERFFVTTVIDYSFQCTESETSVEGSTFAYAIDSGDKAFGKAYSMAVKYAFLKTFVLESKDGEENRTAEGKTSDKEIEITPDMNLWGKFKDYTVGSAPKDEVVAWCEYFISTGKDEKGKFKKLQNYYMGIK